VGGSFEAREELGGAWRRWTMVKGDGWGGSANFKAVPGNFVVEERLFQRSWKSAY
jgi:uncharacterized membrane protein